MTQTVTPRQDNTTLSSVESDLLYEVVDGHIVEKEPLGAYDALLTRFCVFGSNKLILLRIKMAIAP